MPRSIITLHAYLSWLPDRPQGYVRDGQVLPPDHEMADAYRHSAKDDGKSFSIEQLTVLHAGVLDIADRRGWTVHAVFGEWSHFHIVLTWADSTPDDVAAKFSNLLSKFLGDDAGVRGKRWFARNPSCQPIKSDEHLEFLVESYRRRHIALHWRAGDTLPPKLNALLGKA